MNKTITMVYLDRITTDPEQPRTEFDEESITGLAETIEKQGIINPIEIDNNCMIVTGELRYRAAKLLGLQQVPCTIWEGEPARRFERQLVENLGRNDLTDRDRDAAIVKLYRSGLYLNMGELGKAINFSRQRIGNIIESTEFREANPKCPQGTGVSTRDIVSTRGIEEPEQRIRILQSVACGKIKSSDVEQVVKLAKTSNALLDKVLGNEIPLNHAFEAAESIQEIEKYGGPLNDDQKQNLANKMAKDKTLLENNKYAFLKQLRQVATPPKQNKIIEPIGKHSPVQHMIKFKDEVQDRYRIYLGNCDMNERGWAKRILTETRDELSILIEMLGPRQGGEPVE